MPSFYWAIYFNYILISLQWFLIVKLYRCEYSKQLQAHFTLSQALSDTPVNIPITKTTASQNGVALSYHSVRGLYFLAVIFAAIIVILIPYLLYFNCYNVSAAILYSLLYRISS